MRSIKNKNFLDYIVFVLTIFLLILAAILVMTKSKCLGKVKIHIVERGDTLYKISKKYYNNGNLWREIMHYNALSNSFIETGQKIHIYFPDETDWKIICNKIIKQCLKRKNQAHKEKNVIPHIVNGIELADDYIDMSPKEKLLMCKCAIVTSQQESYWEFAIGGAGEFSQYQFKANTIRLTLAWYDLELVDIFYKKKNAAISELECTNTITSVVDIIANIRNLTYFYETKKQVEDTDENLVRFMLDNTNATFIFILHFNKLYRRYNSLWYAWKRYNAGHDANGYANRAMKKYNEIKKTSLAWN